MHCAAIVNFSATPEHLHRVNVVGTGHVLRFAEDADARLVHGSTAFVVRAGGGTPFDAYAASKAAGEALVRESGLPACIARISTVIGDSHSGEVPRLQAFHYMLGVALSGQLPFLPCTPGSRIDLIPRDTVAAALTALACDDNARGDHWITAGPAALPVERVIDIATDAVTTYIHDDEELRDIDPTVFRTRLIDPAVADTIINTVLARSSTSTAPSVIQRAANLMAGYNSADLFPTSLGSIPAGPAAPTIVSADCHPGRTAVRPQERVDACATAHPRLQLAHRVHLRAFAAVPDIYPEAAPSHQCPTSRASARHAAAEWRAQMRRAADSCASTSVPFRRPMRRQIPFGRPQNMRRLPRTHTGSMETGRFARSEYTMIVLGIILLVVGFVAKIAILWTIGIILAVIGAVAVLLGSIGHAVGGRRHYW